MPIIKNTLDKQYKELCNYILNNGVDKADRTDVGTLSTFGYMLRHDMSEGYPLLTSKKMAFKTMVTELKWFLKGRTDIEYLRENNCKIWDGDYIVSGRTDGDLGPIYGYQWRNWNDTGYNGDQIANLLHEIKDIPDSRRLMVNAWNVDQLNEMVLPPCHYGFQVYTRELSLEERFKLANYDYPPSGLPNVGIRRLDERNIPKRELSLLWTQRSVDVFLGLPFNIASYGLLLLLLCEETGYKPGHLIGSLGDTHIYKNHIDAVKQQLNNDEYELPSVTLSNVDILMGEFDVELHNYTSSDRIKAELNN
jgi:thymidylate synthase